jgi:uncharacterized cupredoxin-like copper-binding protein
MSGMIIAMASGMMMGLAVGVIAGILFKGDLFISTVIGAGAGIIIGGLSGIHVGIMGFLDGVLSGLMGGMMGAMLGEMINPSYHEMTTRILFLICLVISFLLIFIINHTKESETEYIDVTQKSIGMMLVFIVIIFSSIAQGPIWSEQDSKLSHQGHSDTSNKNENNTGRIITMDADEFNYLPNSLTIKKGEKVTIILSNVGEVEHDIEIMTEKVQIYSSSNEHDHQDGNIVHIHVAPKSKGKVVFTALEEGTFVFKCTIPGHDEAGMKGTIKII